MTWRVVLRPEVPDDLRALADFFDEQGQISGRRLVEMMLEAFDDLAAMPGKGSLKLYRNRRLHDVRSWSVRGLRKILILYRPIENGIEVLAVMHGMRDVRTHLMRRLQTPPA